MSQPNFRLATVIDHCEGPLFHVGLHRGIVELLADRYLGICEIISLKAWCTREYFIK